MPQMGGGPPDGGEGRDRDLDLTPEDMHQLLRPLARFYNTEERAAGVLRLIRFPMGLVPNWPIDGTPLDFWSMVFQEFDRGVMRMPYRSVIAAVRATYATNEPLADMASRYAAAGPGSEPQAGRVTVVPPRDPGCHVLVWTKDGLVRNVVRRWLEAERLVPREVWHNHETTSLEVIETDPQAVVDQISRRDADGTELPVPDVPGQLTAAELAAAAARFHPAEASTVVQARGTDQDADFATHVGDGITGQVRINDVLHEYRIRPGHRLTFQSVKFQQIRVVFVGASPQWNGQGRLGEVRFSKEADAIRRQARLGQIKLVNEFPHVTRAHVAEIMQADPDVVHIACHGRDGTLYWEDDDGDPDALQAQWLADAIADRADGRTLGGIVLTACEGQSIKPYFEGIARDVIAFNGALADNLAVKFTEYFYDELSRVPVLRTAADRAAKNLGGAPPITPDTQGES